MDGLMEQVALVAGYLPGYAMPVWRTVYLSALAFGLSIACGLIGAAARRSQSAVLRGPAAVYVWFVRGTPQLIQIYLVYYSLPTFGIRLTPEVAGVLTLGVSSGAYMTEIFRSGLSAIPRGQMESAVAVGMGTFSAYRRIILPQMVRITLPAATNEAIATLKSSSLLALITVYEILLHTRVVIAETFSPIEFYLVATILYLILADLLARLSRWGERRYRWSL